MRLYTIGFTHKSAEQFFGLLRDQGVKVLVVYCTPKIGHEKRAA
jgi:hypothetical protein